ncbi:hypothetical protein CJ179_10570 [Rhodococcus sp. ACS1]|nr:hypothetical protein CJ179_10570 [Rhodococcus sp. ACS1]
MVGRSSARRLEAATIVEGRPLPYLQLFPVVDHVAALPPGAGADLVCSKLAGRISFNSVGREMSGMPAGGRWLVLPRQTVAATT